MHVQGCWDLTSVIALSGRPPTFGTWCFLFAGKLGQSLVPLRLIFNCSHRGYQRRGDIKAWLWGAFWGRGKVDLLKVKSVSFLLKKCFFLRLLVFWIKKYFHFSLDSVLEFFGEVHEPTTLWGFWYSFFLIAWNHLRRYYNHISLTTFVGSQTPRR